MQNSQENLPIQNANEYIESQKENYELPIHKSGIVLSAALVNILNSATLITREHLNYQPEVFEPSLFKRMREDLISKDKKQRSVFLEQLSLSLSVEHKEDLNLLIESFLSDFTTYFNTYKASQNEKEDLEYLIFEDSFYSILEPEVQIQDLYETHADLKEFLISMGVEEETFEKIEQLTNEENKIKYTTH